MLHEITHEKYGKIVFDENFWTGKKKLFINGTLLKKVARKKYLFEQDGEKIEIVLAGSFLAGSAIQIKDEKIQLTPQVKWYELIIPILFACLVIAWGNNVHLCKIIPIVGGAIGGAITGAMTVINIISIKSINNILIKLIVELTLGILTFVACWIGAMIILKFLA